MRVKRESACIHLLRIRNVEHTHTYTDAQQRASNLVSIFISIFLLLPHLSSEFVPTLFAIWLWGSGHNSNAWILCAVVCSCKLHGTHTRNHQLGCLLARFLLPPLPVQPYAVLIVRKRKRGSPKKGILLLLAIGFSLFACVCKCVGVCVYVCPCVSLHVFLCISVCMCGPDFGKQFATHCQ